MTGNSKAKQVNLEIIEQIKERTTSIKIQNKQQAYTYNKHLSYLKLEKFFKRSK